MNDATPPAPTTLGGVPVQSAQDNEHLISLLLWGPAGAGKTTLAATAPGRKLWINFDPGGPASVAFRNDIDIADFSSSQEDLTAKFKQTDPFGLSKVIAGYDTIVVDSTTNAEHLSLMQGIKLTKGASIERPSPGAYGARTNLTKVLIKNVLKIARMHGKHAIFITHEAPPEKDQESGRVLHITMSMGGGLLTGTPIDFSEVWHLYDTGTERRILTRAARMRKPMKSRMFKSGVTEFVWKYDADHVDAKENNRFTIAEWYSRWRDSGWQKQDAPK